MSNLGKEDGKNSGGDMQLQSHNHSCSGRSDSVKFIWVEHLLGKTTGWQYPAPQRPGGPRNEVNADDPGAAAVSIRRSCQFWFSTVMASGAAPSNNSLQRMRPDRFTFKSDVQEGAPLRTFR